jgi:hypothetical protein
MIGQGLMKYHARKVDKWDLGSHCSKYEDDRQSSGIWCHVVL